MTIGPNRPAADIQKGFVLEKEKWLLAANKNNPVAIDLLT